MPNLLSATLTAAQTQTTTSVFRMRGARTALIQAAFTYGSGGTNVTAYVQTSLDGGTTWTDVAAFQFTTASARKIFNLSSATPVTSIGTPGDGALNVNNCIDGIIGESWRVKWASTGTYAGGTTLKIDVILNNGLV